MLLSRTKEYVEMMRILIVAVAVAVGAAANLTAQTTERPPSRKPAIAPARSTSARISVRDHDGASLGGVRLLVSGDGTGEFTTGPAGTAILPNLKPGMYRVRCELDGFITLEREFTLGSGAWNPIDVVLNAAPPPPAPAKPAPEPQPAAAVPSSAPPVTLSILEFLDHNFIGRNPIKESILACKPLETVRLLQMRENVARHVHDRADEIIYVVAGEGAVRIGDDTTPLHPGSLVVVPNGSSHSFEHREKNPLIVLSTLTGAACESPTATR
jgi:hypothetical protein